MRFTREDVRQLLIPAGIALVISLAYFLITQNWTSLGNPIASIVALAGGVIGAGVGIGLDRRRERRRPREANQETA